MSVSVLILDVVHTCKDIVKAADSAAKVWGSAKDLCGGLKEGTYSRDLVIGKLWQCKSSIQTIIDSMVRQMSVVHLLVSGALATMPHSEQKETFLQNVMEHMLQAQMAGAQANGAADMVAQMLQDVVTHKDG